MTEVLTVRVPPALLCKAEARAAQLGLDRAKYVRGLIEEDVAAAKGGKKHEFASEDLIGSYVSPTPSDSATNARVHEVMKQRQMDKRARSR